MRLRLRTTDQSGDLALLDPERDVVERLLAWPRGELERDVPHFDLSSNGPSVVLPRHVRWEAYETGLAPRIDRRDSVNFYPHATHGGDGFVEGDEVGQEVGDGKESVEDREETRWRRRRQDLSVRARARDEGGKGHSLTSFPLSRPW